MIHISWLLTRKISCKSLLVQYYDTSGFWLISDKYPLVSSVKFNYRSRSRCKKVRDRWSRCDSHTWQEYNLETCAIVSRSSQESSDSLTRAGSVLIRVWITLLARSLMNTLYYNETLFRFIVTKPFFLKSNFSCSQFQIKNWFCLSF